MTDKRKGLYLSSFEIKKSYANIITKEEYSVEQIQLEIKPESRIGTLGQLIENIESVEIQTKETLNKFKINNKS